MKLSFINQEELEMEGLLQNEDKTSTTKEPYPALGSPTSSHPSTDQPLDENDTLGSLSGYPRAVKHITRQPSSESNFSVRSVQVSISHVGPPTGAGQKFTVFNYGSQDINHIPSSPTILISSSQQSSIQPEYQDSGSRRHSIIWMRQHSEAQGENELDYQNIDNAENNNVLNYKNVGIFQRQASLRSGRESENYEMYSGLPGRGDEVKPKNDFYIDIPDDSFPNKFATITTKVKKVNVLEIIRRGRIFAKRRKDRLFKKNGDKNINFINVRKKHKKFIQDLFTTLIDTKWRYLLLMFIIAFLVTWLGFACVWLIMAKLDGSLDAPVNGTDDLSIPCVVGINNFATAVLFSIETQQTIGYGTRAVTDECPVAIIFIMLQSFVGVVLSCILTGLFFAKFARPKRRAETILFSKQAVICEHNGRRCLMFRVGDMRQSHMISVNISGILVDTSLTTEGETLPYFQHNLHIESEAEDLFFLAWPLKAIHYIDESSPLWKFSSEDLLAADFEIVIIFVGTNSSTGQTIQVITSYLPSEIMWGHKLDHLLTNKSDTGRFTVDYCRFNDTSPCEISERSAYEESQWKAQNQVATGFEALRRPSTYLPYGGMDMQNNNYRQMNQCV